MAITMSGATVDSSLRDQLYSNTVNDVTVGGETAYTEVQGGFGYKNYRIGGTEVATGAALAGIDSEFLGAITRAINQYIGSIITPLNKLNDISEFSNNAFKGSSINTSLQTFATSIRSVASSYIGALRGAEKSIIRGVQNAYKQQDTDISGNLNTDSSNLVEK